MINNSPRGDFNSANGIGTAAIIAFCGIIVTAILSVIVAAAMLISPGKSFSLDNGQQVDVGFLFVGLIALVQLAARIGCIVLFLIWLNRSFKNLIALGAPYLEYTPGWAVGWWFIPFANLVKPYQVVKELYSSSHQAAEPAAGTDTSNIGLWWATFIGANVVLRVADALIGEVRGGMSPYFPLIYLIGQIFFAGAALLCILIIRNVNRWQETAATRMAMDALASPPPPPDFEVEQS